MVNYTPINLDAYFKKNQVTQKHKGGLNFILLIIALITAAIFALLLFVMIKNRREEKITIPSTAPVQNIKKDFAAPTLEAPNGAGLAPTIATPPIDQQIPLISPTLIPEEEIAL